MSLVFADTYYFIALISPRDSAHRKAMEYSDRVNPELLTTCWIMTELADGLASTPNRHLFASILSEAALGAGNILLPPSEKLYSAGIDLYASRPDKHWSLTDCMSFAAMQEHGVTEALTADQHFEQAGFVPLLALS